MKRPMIVRAAPDFDVSGRTMEGVAVYWDRATRVTDDNGRTYYREAYSPSSANKSMRERASVPLLYFHSMKHGTPGWKSKWSGESFGAVKFRAAREGLMFSVTLNNTPGADDMLDLYNAKEIEDVSLAHFPMKTRSTPSAEVYYDEVALVELSLAPVGAGQHPGAKVLTVRADQTDELAQRMRLLKNNLH